MTQKPYEITICLSSAEIGIIISSLQTLSLSEEKQLSRQFGSVPTLYNKLHSIWDEMDHSELEMTYDYTDSSY